MTDELDVLRARMNALVPGDWEEWVVVSESILRLKAGDLLATRGLALALIKLGAFGRADEVVQEALLLHPGDDILVRRAADIPRGRRASEAAAAKAKTSSTAARAPSTWIKAVHYDGDGWKEPSGTKLWISDPGQRDANGERLYTAGGEP